MISFEDLRQKQKNGGLNPASFSMLSSFLKRAAERFRDCEEDQLAAQTEEFAEAIGKLPGDESEEDARKHYEKLKEFKAFAEGGRDNEKTNYQRLKQELLPFQQESFGLALDFVSKELGLGIREDLEDFEGIGAAGRIKLHEDEVADSGANTTAAAYIERIRNNGFREKDPSKLTPKEETLYLERIVKIMAARELADSRRHHADKLQAKVLNSDMVNGRAVELMRDGEFRKFIKSLQDDPVKLKKAISAATKGHGGGLDDMFRKHLLEKKPAELENRNILKRWMPTAKERIEALQAMAVGSTPANKAKIAAEIIQIRNMVKADKGKVTSLKVRIPVQSEAGDLAANAKYASKSEVLRDPSLDPLLTEGHGGNMMERARLLSNSTLYPEPDARTQKFYDANCIKNRMEQIQKEADSLQKDMKNAASIYGADAAEYMPKAKALLAEYMLLDGKTRDPATGEIDEMKRLKDVPWGEIKQMNAKGPENNPAFRNLFGHLDAEAMAGRLSKLASKNQSDFIKGLAEEQINRQEAEPEEELEDAENVMNTSGFDDDGGLDYEPEDVPSKLFGPLAGS